MAWTDEQINKLKGELEHETAMRREAIAQLGETVCQRDDYKDKYEEALGALHFSRDEREKLEEELKKVRSECAALKRQIEGLTNPGGET